MSLDPALAAETYCYLTTTGRVTGNAHTIEIWFGYPAPPEPAPPSGASTIYLLAGSGERADWVRNARRRPQVEVRIAHQRFGGRFRVVEDGAEDSSARALLLGKYQPGYARHLDEWSRTALPVAIDLTLEG